MNPNAKKLNTKFFWLFGVSFFVSSILAILVWYFSPQIGINYIGISSASRALTGFFGAFIGAMVFIISLTSTTYTPKITELFLKRPIAGGGLFIIVLGQFLLIATSLFNDGHHWHKLIMLLTIAVTFLTTALVMPYLYYLFHFIDPKFFLPEIKNNILKDIEKLHLEKTIQLNCEKEIFSNYDTLMNVASTAIKKDDRQLMMSIIDMSNEILSKFIQLQGSEKFNWRINNPQFIPGISEEGKFLLEKKKNWPEFYILGKVTRLVLNINQSQNEIVAYVCEKFLETIDECTLREKDDVLELHIMALNTILRSSIETKNLDRFQAVSYHYRLAIELLFSNTKARDLACKRLIRYAELSIEEGFIMGTETILYDIGRIIVFYSYEDEQYGIEFLENYAFPLWDKYIQGDDRLSKIAWKSIVKAFWEIRAKGFAILPKLILQRYLLDNPREHKDALDSLFNYKNEFYWEINDRLVNMVNLTRKSLTMARDFYDKNFSEDSENTA